MAEAVTGATVPPVYDPAPVEQLRSMLGDEMVVELVEEFERSGQDILVKLDIALAREDAAACQREVHGLKSAAASLGLMRLSGLCLSMEIDCRDRRMDHAAQSIATIREQYQQACAALQHLKQT